MAVNGDSFNNYAARRLAYDAPTGATKTTLQTLGSQEEQNQALEQIMDQFVSAQSGLAGAAANAKREALQKNIAGMLFKHFFTVYETGFALSQQWSDMEANV